ncbi:hypothetical protein T10_7714 [Trichinella papuae]|uniref:Uncharacterized protein n=1 Tax=Trichinella papuae TaxID=268474 RepID=A0A0V1MN91_9BILA|nr:hypothetical protein T10_7714 [Trichinella papuae]
MRLDDNGSAGFIIVEVDREYRNTYESREGKKRKWARNFHSSTMDAAHRWVARACIPEQVKAEISIVDRRSGQLLHRCWTEMTAEMFAQEAMLFLGTAVQARAASQAVCLYLVTLAGQEGVGLQVL